MGDEIKEKDSQLDQEPTDAGKDMIEEAYAYEGIFPCTPPTIPGYVDLCECWFGYVNYADCVIARCAHVLN